MNWRDRLAILVLRVVTRSGSIRLVTPSGLSKVIGDGEPSAEIAIVDPSTYRRILRAGVNGFADAFIAGEADTPDIVALMRWGATNHETWTSGRSAKLVAPLRRLWQRFVPPRRHERVTTMVDHYDLGNDFYEAWLDDTMTYSSGRFGSPAMDLSEAQRAKYAAIADHAELRPGMRVLEIGCGWGGFAAYASVERGVEVVGVTISSEQAEYARKRVADLGVADMVDIRLQDFREIDEAFDAVVSIEMIESVDETVWPALFGAFHDRVAPGGRSVVQAITIEDERFEGYRDREDFIRRHVFPGGQLPSAAVLSRLAEDHGLDEVTVDMFGADYARTLDMWLSRFRRAWPSIQDQPGFDQPFRKMWELYLAYCQAGFEAGVIDVGQWVFVRRG